MTENPMIRPEDSDSPEFAALALAIFKNGEATQDEFENLLHYCETISLEQITTLLDLPTSERNEAAVALAGQIAHGLRCLESCPDLPDSFDGLF